MEKFIFIQARMSSQRLPGKVLLPFRGSTILKHTYDKCKKINGVKSVFILTSNEPEDDEIENMCNLNKISIFRGSLSNVLERFQDAARLHCNSEDFIIRICADSPLSDEVFLQDFSNQISEKYFYFSTRFFDGDSFKSSTGKGNNVDAIKVSELFKLKPENELIREHIIYGFEFGKKFKLYKTKSLFNENDSIDTLEDYERLS